MGLRGGNLRTAARFTDLVRMPPRLPSSLEDKMVLISIWHTFPDIRRCFRAPTWAKYLALLFITVLALTIFTPIAMVPAVTPG